MYAAPRLALKYLHYWLTASNSRGHGMHSPFVFDFIRQVLHDKNEYPAFAEVEALRKRLRADQQLLEVEDLGAGSGHSLPKQRSIASIAGNAAKPPRLGQLLYRMVRYYRPQVLLELGTSLGITSSYLAKAAPAGRLITLEGATAVAEKAALHFQQQQLNNIRQVVGNFDDTLPQVLGELPTVDFVFIDGNHRQEPTERYFRQLIPHVKNDTLLVFDDIHWSEEMEKAWAVIRAHPSVRCTIDLFFLGIVLFRGEFREKQHFTIRF